MRYKEVNNAEDFKNSDGMWVTAWSDSTLRISYKTRSMNLWGAVNERCGNQKFKARQPTYIRCTNDFGVYQEFAEWSNLQYGYMNKEINGRFWQLDKDIRVPGNKSYSSNTCCFVPSRLNNLFIRGNSNTSVLPLGVDLHEGKYRSRINGLDGRSVFLGHHKNYEDAHIAWQKARINILTEAITFYSELPSTTLDGISAHRDKVCEDIKSNTFSYN